MNKLYNIQSDITSGFRDFIKSSFPSIRKTQLNFIPSLMFGMISSESCASSDIASSLKDELHWAQFDSVVKRINRFWNNNLFDGYLFFHNIISSVLNSYILKHNDNRIHISFDHMFSHDNYAVFMISMRIGTQAIPIWFRCFHGGKNSPAPFKVDIFKQGIKYVHDLFNDKDVDLIFLADRWFHDASLLDYIDSLGHTYCIRLRSDISVYTSDGNKIKSKKLKHKKYHAVVHKDVFITKHRLKTNIVYSKTDGTSDPWIIATNNNVDSAIKDYSYRFSIECLFKNQKSNGFNLNKINNMSIHAFINMYSLLCTCLTYLTIIGADFSKNSKCYKNIKITTHKIYLIDGKKIKKRVKSLFNTGLTLFKIAFNSSTYVRLPFTFKLYDI